MIEPAPVGAPRLLYRGRRDGFKGAKFLEHCAHKGSTLTLVLSENGKVFGGYTNIGWALPPRKTRRKGAGRSFLFTIDGFGGKNKLHKLKCLRPEAEVYQDPNGLPVFGDGHFLYLDGDQTGASYTKSGSYELPPDIEGDPNDFLAGGRCFAIVNIEVYCVDTPIFHVNDIVDKNMYFVNGGSVKTGSATAYVNPDETASEKLIARYWTNQKE